MTARTDLPSSNQWQLRPKFGSQKGGISGKARQKFGGPNEWTVHSYGIPTWAGEGKNK